MQLFLYVFCVAIVAELTPAFAQEVIQAGDMLPLAEAITPQPPIDQPPSRVGRISLVSGNVGLRTVGQGSWVEAELNQPAFTGEALRTDPAGRSEIGLGRDAIDLANSTEVEITNLTDQFTQLSLVRGRIGLHLRQVDEGETIEVDFPQGGVWLQGPGRYDIDAGDGDRLPRVEAFDGSAHFVGDAGDFWIADHQMAVLSGSEGAPAVIEEAAADAFVEWCRDHDFDDTRLAAPYYVSPSVTGLTELDSAGIWKNNSVYGPVWFPTESGDWAPYRFGHWSWIDPWGWTWIDDKPWGFAPSHYGRWTLVDEHWAWVPGSIVAHPYYMPAVVAFLGTRGVGLSSEDGATVAWFPLGPAEAYWPTYTRDVNYVRNLNNGNVQDPTTIGMRADGEPPLEVFDQEFANRQFATIVPRSIFVNGRPVAPARVSLPEQRLQNAPVLMGSPQIAPPSAERVAHATPTAKATATRVAAVEARRREARLLRTISMSLRGRALPTTIRGAHLRVPSYAGQPRGRQLIVLHMAHPQAGLGRRVRG